MLTKVNIAKKLQDVATKNVQKKIASDQEGLDLINSQLNQEDAETTEVLKYFGVGQKRQELKTRIDGNKVLLDGAYVSHDDIKKVCLDYDLRCLPARNFVGGIPFKALNDIRVFENEWKKNPPKKPTFRESFVELEIGGRQYAISHDPVNGLPIIVGYNGKRIETPPAFADNLFVIAPAKHFVSLVDPKADPVILFREATDKYKVITQFGDDFSFMRRVKGFVKSNTILLNGIGIFLTAAIVILCFFLIENPIICGLCGGILVSTMIGIMSISNKYRENWNSARDLPFGSE